MQIRFQDLRERGYHVQYNEKLETLIIQGDRNFSSHHIDLFRDFSESCVQEIGVDQRTVEMTIESMVGDLLDAKLLRDIQGK
tara:strand:+ start:472 stop:717 length:246 start_codon:yes stop_codon:yes gene_type:complete